MYRDGAELNYTVLDLRMQGVPQDRVSVAAEWVGDVLDRQLRAEDVLLRFHNGRFVVILVNVRPDVAAIVVERLRLAVEALKTTGLVVDALDFELAIENHLQPEEAAEPSVRAAVEDAMAKLRDGS